MDLYPPAGFQDRKRFSEVPPEEREYALFCLEFCGSVLRRRPGHLEALKLAAGYLTELGYYANGLEVDQALRALLPDDPGVAYNLACSLALNGMRAEALETLDQAIEKGYDNAEHMAEDGDLDALKAEAGFKLLLTRAAGRKNRRPAGAG